jgi:hypothetical protein
MENVAMTVTEEMLRAAESAHKHRQGDWRDGVRAALEAAEAVRPVPALPTREEIERKLAECRYLSDEVGYVFYLLRQHAPSAPPEPDTRIKGARAYCPSCKAFLLGGEWFPQRACGTCHTETLAVLNHGDGAWGELPEPDTRPLQVTATEWREYLDGRGVCVTPLDLLNAILARRDESDFTAEDELKVVEAELRGTHDEIELLRAKLDKMSGQIAIDAADHARSFLRVCVERDETQAKLDALRKACEHLAEESHSNVGHIRGQLRHALRATQDYTADKSPSADNVFGDAGNDFFAQQHMLSQPAAPVVEPEPLEQRVERIETACEALYLWFVGTPGATAIKIRAALAAVGKDADHG